MTDLPPAVLDNALLHAGYAATSGACKVSRTWRARAEGEDLWRFFTLKQWPTLGKVVEALEKRQEPGLLRAFFRNRILADLELDLHWATVRDARQDAHAKYFQHMYLQCEMTPEGPNKTRRSIGGATVDLANKEETEWLFWRGVRVTGLPQGLTKADLRRARVEWTMLDPKRGVCMLLVAGRDFVAGRSSPFMECRMLEGSHYAALLLGCHDEHVVAHPALYAQTEGTSLASVDARIRLYRVDGETDEMEDFSPRWWSIWELLDCMTGIMFRARRG